LVYLLLSIFSQNIAKKRALHFVCPINISLVSLPFGDALTIRVKQYPSRECDIT
jgi:hypothetical protein